MTRSFKRRVIAMKMYYVYLLKLINGNIYTSSTPNLKRRLIEYGSGESLATKNFKPVKLMWYGVFPTRLLARRFKNYLLTGSGQAFRNKRLLKK